MPRAKASYAIKIAPIKRLPLEILANIADFLEGKNLAHLRQVNHLFKDAVNTQYHVYSSLYQRLRKIEPTLSPVLPTNNFLKTYHEAFQKVKTLQQDEIQYLTKNHGLDIDTFAIQEIKVIDLEKLEQQSQKLNEVNSNIIKRRIDLNSTTLDLKYITRLPKQLFEAKEYANYWKGLIVLDISNNCIRFLPTIIGNCQALVLLNCGDNQLNSLPETLGNCRALETLCCSKNQLTSLPETLGNCHSLKNLLCDYNELSALPKTLVNCQSLSVISCTHNQLTVLPETLSQCQALAWLSCWHNLLTSMPDKLIAKLGADWTIGTLIHQQNTLTWLTCEQHHLSILLDKLAKGAAEWARDTLIGHKHSLHNAAIEPGQALQISNTLTPAHQAIKRQKHPISAREKRQLDESAILPHGAKRTQTLSKMRNK
jgi:Leucine-rich repeat (LRR) protein